jgi:hypothetical protein
MVLQFPLMRQATVELWSAWSMGAYLICVIVAAMSYVQRWLGLGH